MRIPVSQGPQEVLRPLPDAQVVAPGVRGPSTARALAGALGEINEALSEANNIRVEDQMNQAQARGLAIRKDAFQQLGKNVIPTNGKTFTDQYLGQFDSDMQKMEDGLHNNDQRRLFRKRAALLRQNLHTQLEGHEASQIKAYYDEVDWGTVETVIRAARENVGNVSELAFGQVRCEGALASLAKRNGWAPERAAEERVKALTQFHGGVVGAAMDAGKLGYARDYLEMHGKDMDADALKKIRKTLQTANTDSQSIDLSRQALEAARAAGLDRAKGYELIDKLAGNDKDLRDKAMSDFDHGFRVYKEQQQENEERDEASVWAVVQNGKGPAEAYKTISTLKYLDDTGKAKLTKAVQGYFKGDAEDRAEAREAKKEQRAATLLPYQLDPDRVYRMTEDQITALFPKVGSEGVSKLVAMKQEMQKRGPQSFQVDADYFGKVALDAGLDPKKKGHVKTLAQVKARIETQISEEQAANAQHPNRQISDERRREITRYWFGDVLTKKRYGWTGSLGEGTTTKKRYEVENVQDILTAIPPEHMGRIVAYLEEKSRRAGRRESITLADLTPEEIVQLDAQLFPRGKE